MSKALTSKIDKIKESLVKCGNFLDRHKKVFLTIFFVLVAVRLWLFFTMNWNIVLESYYDSRLEINSAISIASGDWGGEYSKFVLCKGLAFPIFLAILFWFRMPYGVGLFLITVLASFLFARSLKPVVKNGWLRKIIFLFMLFNPVGLGGEMAYPYRNALVPMAVLIVISCILAIYLRRKAETKKLLPWGITGLLFTGFFWNLREDSIWFLPFIIMGALIPIGHYWWEHKKKINYKKMIGFSLIALAPIVGILVWNTGISIVNKVNYGIYTTQDRTKTYEAKALGALIRIDDGADLENDYWVSSEAIELAKKASPTFRSLKLEPFDRWFKIADYSIWALRDSVADSGYYKDAAETDEVYKKIYEELEEGFKNGTLKKKNGFQLSDTSGLYSTNEMLRPIPTAFHSLINHAFYNEYEAKLEEIKDVKNEGDIVLYEGILGTSLLRSEDDLNKLGADESTRRSNDNLRMTLRINKKISNIIIKIYNVISPVLLLIAFVGVIIKIITMFKNRNFTDYGVEMLIFILGILLTILFNAYTVGLWGTGFELTADSPLFKSYTTPQTVMVSVLEVIGVVCLCKSFVKAKKKRERKK